MPRTRLQRAVALLLSISFAVIAGSPVRAQALPVCEAMTVEALNGLSALQYESSSQTLGGCRYLPSSEGTDDHVVSVSLPPIGSIKELVEAFPGGEEPTVFERPAYFIDGAVWAQLLAGTVSVEPILGISGEAAGMDALGYAMAIAEVVVPGLDAVAAAVADPAAVDAGPVEPSLCDAVPMAEINALGALQYDEPFIASDTACVFEAADTQAGSHQVSLFLDGVFSFDNVKTFNPGGEDVEVAGVAGYADGAHGFSPGLITETPQVSTRAGSGGV